MGGFVGTLRIQFLHYADKSTELGSNERQLKPSQSIQGLVSNLIAVNIRTSKAFQDKLDNMIQNEARSIVAKSFVEFQDCLSSEEIEIYEHLLSGRVIKSETRLTEYTESMSLESAMTYIMDRRTSIHYPQLIQTYRSQCNGTEAQIEFTQKLDPESFEIPDRYSWCSSPQEYLATLQEERTALENLFLEALTVAGRLLQSIKAAVDDDFLQPVHYD